MRLFVELPLASPGSAKFIKGFILNNFLLFLQKFRVSCNILCVGVVTVTVSPCQVSGAALSSILGNVGGREGGMGGIFCYGDLSVRSIPTGCDSCN